jgi:hypothetical protein
MRRAGRAILCGPAKKNWRGEVAPRNRVRARDPVDIISRFVLFKGEAPTIAAPPPRAGSRGSLSQSRFGTRAPRPRSFCQSGGASEPRPASSCALAAGCDVRGDLLTMPIDLPRRAHLRFQADFRNPAPPASRRGGDEALHERKNPLDDDEHLRFKMLPTWLECIEPMRASLDGYLAPYPNPVAAGSRQELSPLLCSKRVLSDNP